MENIQVVIKRIFLENKLNIFQSNFKDVDELIVVSDNKTDYELLKIR